MNDQKLASLDEGWHWEIEKPEKVEIFSKLTLIFPHDAYLCLAGGEHTPEIKTFIHTYASNDPMPHLHPDLRKTVNIPINDETMTKLTDLSEHHAEPEIADHLCVCNKNERLLEWFDFPFDPLAISLKIPEDSIRRFCKAVGVKYKLELG